MTCFPLDVFGRFAGKPDNDFFRLTKGIIARKRRPSFVRNDWSQWSEIPNLQEGPLKDSNSDILSMRKLTACESDIFCARGGD
ncbi:MAG TPA: hypothetical protein DCP92_11140 [Nitrospiraceae bacterium]|nr:hypothetical protein [Nitrospiraceae bacterium]